MLISNVIQTQEFHRETKYNKVIRFMKESETKNIMLRASQAGSHIDILPYNVL